MANKAFSQLRAVATKTALFTAMISSSALLTSCGEKAEDRQIASGLACLDSATTTEQADVCLDKVQGLESSQAYLIRCSANFIAQGITGKRLADAFQKMKDNNSGGTQGTTALMAYLVFRSDGVYARHTASITYNNCKASGVKSMLGLATIANVPATVAGLIPPGSSLDPSSPSFDPNALKQKFTDAYTANDPATNAQIGTLAQTAQSVYCGTGSGFKDQDICQKLDSALAAGGGNAANVGRSLLNLLQQ